jgi:hypothetical protein
MSEIVSNPAAQSSKLDGRERQPYEAPSVTLVGNARDLLAGAAGTIADVAAPPATQPSG